jgi:gliding motility-associatede transport system auxiliary component
MRAMMDRRARELLITSLLVACFALLLADGARWFVRLDLTRSKAYSISPVSREILRGIPEQVHVTYFLSDTLRSLSPSPGRIIDLLREYEAESRGKLVVTVLDPDRTGLGENARRFGILPQQIQVIQQNEQRTVDVYSGIAVDYLDRYTSLPAVFSPDGLEYSLSFAVRKVLAGRRLVVGIVIGEPGRTLADNFDTLRTGLSRDYSLHEYLPGDPIPPEVDALIVAGGTQWGSQELRPIDAYVAGGGKVMFAVKGIAVQTEHVLRAAPVGRSALLDMLGSYGVGVGRQLVMDTAARDYRLPQQRPNGQIGWETIGHYPPWVSIQGPNVSSRNPITARFTGLDLLWPVALTPVPREGVQEKPLVKTSTSAWLEKPPFVIDPYRVNQQGVSPGQYVLAMALTGRFPSWYSPTARSPTSRMIVVGDDDFLTDLMQFSDSLANVLFVENAVLWLSGNDDLLSVKTRAGTEGRLDRISDPAARSRFILAAEAVNVVLIPLGVLLAGLLARMRRRERKS